MTGDDHGELEGSIDLLLSSLVISAFNASAWALDKR